MARRKKKENPFVSWEGQFAPEWFYPFARVIHAEIERRETEDGHQADAQDGRTFRNDTSPEERVVGFRMLGTKGQYVYMSGTVKLGQSLYRRYKIRIPRKRFFQVFDGAGGVKEVTTET